MSYLGKQNCEKCNKKMIVRTTQKKYCKDCKRIQYNNYRKLWLKNQKNMKKHKILCKNWQLNNKERVRENQRNNPNFKLVQKKWRNNNKPYLRLKQKRYVKNNPLKILAHNLSQKIEKKPYCDICKSTNKLEKHHWRYDKPLLVNTLCKQCHTIQHIKNFRGYLS